MSVHTYANRRVRQWVVVESVVAIAPTSHSLPRSLCLSHPPTPSSAWYSHLASDVPARTASLVFQALKSVGGFFASLVQHLATSGRAVFALGASFLDHVIPHFYRNLTQAATDFRTPQTICYRKKIRNSNTNMVYGVGGRERNRRVFQYSLLR